MKTLLSIAITASILLAGCTTESADLAEPPVAQVNQAASPGATPQKTPANTSVETSPDPEPVNHAPAAMLRADMTEVEAPATVTFTMEASDEDGDPFNWTLTSGATQFAAGTNATLASEIPWSFNEEGTYNVTLNVTDGMLGNQSWILIHVSAPPPPPPTSTTVVAMCTSLVTGSGGGVSGVNQVWLGMSGTGYIVTGTSSETGAYIDDNGMAGLQTPSTCPDNPDTAIGS